MIPRLIANVVLTGIPVVWCLLLRAVIKRRNPGYLNDNLPE